MSAKNGSVSVLRRAASLAAAAMVLFATGSAFAVQHVYIDVNAPAGGNGSQEKPYQQITSALTGITQDRVYHIAGGTYEPVSFGNSGGTQVLTFLGEGTPDNPTIIDGHGTQPCLKCAGWSEFQKPLIVDNIVFTNGFHLASSGNAIYGGGIQWKTVLAVSNCKFIDCQSTLNGTKTSYGGAIGGTGGGAFTNCVFRNCTATAGGGAIYFSREDQDIIITNCVFDSCSAGTGSGGAIYVQRKYTTGASEETIRGCRISDCVFTNNTAGTASVMYAMVLECERTTFVDNEATSEGGVWTFEDKLTNDKMYIQTNVFANCTFRGNTGVKNALFWGCDETSGPKWKRVRLDTCTIEDNASETKGCVVDGHIRYLYMTNCVVRGNSGAGLFNIESCDGSAKVFAETDFLVQIDDTAFVGNEGGSGSLVTIPRSAMRMDRCRFSKNNARTDFAINGIDAQAYTNVVRNCLFEGNTNSYAVADVFWGQAQALTFCNNTCVGNRGGAAKFPLCLYEGFALEYSSKGALYANNVFYDNRTLDGTAGNDVQYSYWNPVCNNNWFENNGKAPVSNGVRDNVVASGSPFVTRDGVAYMPDSACRDHGATYGWMTGANDIRGAGHPRIVGDAPDMGCYERGVAGLLMLLR